MDQLGTRKGPPSREAGSLQKQRATAGVQGMGLQADGGVGEKMLGSKAGRGWGVGQGHKQATVCKRCSPSILQPPRLKKKKKKKNKQKGPQPTMGTRGGVPDPCKRRVQQGDCRAEGVPTRAQPGDRV